MILLGAPNRLTLRSFGSQVLVQSIFSFVFSSRSQDSEKLSHASQGAGSTCSEPWPEMEKKKFGGISGTWGIWSSSI